MRILLGIAAIAGILVVEAVRGRREWRIELFRREHGITSADALGKYLDVFRRYAEVYASSTAEALAAVAQLGAAWSEAYRFDGMHVELERCWRIIEDSGRQCDEPVPRDDELGLCGRCRAELRELER